MGSMLVFCLFCTLFLHVGASAFLKMDAVSLVRNIAKLALEIFKVYKENQPLEANNEIISELSSKIDSIEKLTTGIPLLLQKNKIEETHLQIRSIMIDLKNVLEAKEPERSEYKRIFVERSPLVIPRARYLSKHLLQVIPEINNNIIENLADTTRCNLTALQDLQAEVMELILNSLLIELTVLSTSNDLKFSNVEEFWQKEIADISAEFERIEKKCESKIPVLIVQDMDKHSNPKQLQRANKERYLWTWNDVFMFNNEMPEKFAHYDVRHVKVFKHSSNGMMKIVTYGTNNLETSSLRDILLEIVEEEDIYRLHDPKDIVSRTKKGMCKRRLRYSAIVVYFNKNICQPFLGPDMWTQMKVRWTKLGKTWRNMEANWRSSNAIGDDCSVSDGTTDNYDDGPGIKIDNDSQALRVDLNEVTISKCTSNWCAINWGNWLNEDIYVTGHFTVYVAVDSNQKFELHRKNICETCQC